jgi:RNA polymerase primary sigma factor
MHDSPRYERDEPESEQERHAPIRDELATYARAMRRHPLLDRKGERALAIDIEARSRALWTALLADALPRVTPIIAEHLPAAKPALRRVAGATARTRDVAIRRAAARLHALDVDHLVADELVERLGGRNDAVAVAARAVADARSRFVQANIGLVLHLAARYRSSALSYADFVQEGMFGLMKAVARFDHRRGLRFSTYAGWWIRHAMGRALADHGRLVRIPVHVHEARQRLAAADKALRIQLAREPSRDELVVATGMTGAKVDSIQRSGTVQEVHLDAPVGDDGDQSRSDVFVDPREGTAVDDAMHQQALADAARQHMRALTSMEREVLRRRVALDDADREETFQEIAKTHGLSRERIRQIQESALKKLRARLARNRQR